MVPELGISMCQRAVTASVRTIGMRRRIDPLSVVVAAVVGLILGVLLAAPGETFEKPRAEARAAVAPDSHGQALLDELHLVNACRTQAAEPATAARSYVCCTQCHNVQADHGKLFQQHRNITKLLQGCQACHKSA